MTLYEPMLVKHGSHSFMLWGWFLTAGTGWLVRIEGRINAVKYREVLEEKPFHTTWDEVTLHLSIRQWSQNNSGLASWQVCDCPWEAQPNPRLKIHRTSVVERPEHSSSQTVSSHPRWRSSRGWRMEGKWNKLPKFRTAELVETYLRRLKAVIATKCMDWIKCLNTFVYERFTF